MEYNKIEEEARINEMILERAGNAAEDTFNATEDIAVKGYQAIENGVVKGYKTIENGVVGGYKKVEHAFVSGWEKVEDTCVDVLFKKEGETTEEAKERLSRNAGAHKAGADL